MFLCMKTFQTSEQPNIANFHLLHVPLSLSVVLLSFPFAVSYYSWSRRECSHQLMKQICGHDYPD